MTDANELAMETEAQRLTYECQKVVRAGVWLIRNGYGRLMILPYSGPTGCWRFALHVPEDREAIWFHYTAANGPNYLMLTSDLKLRRNVSVEKLAKAILNLTPEHLKQQCAGPLSTETARWLLQLESTLECRLLPEAFHEQTSDHST